MRFGSLRPVPLLLAAVFGSVPAFADDPPLEGSLLVLVQAEEGIPGHWAAEIQSEAERAAAVRDELTIVAPPQVGLGDVQLALGCPAWNASCAGKVANMMGAELVLNLELKTGPGSKGRVSWEVIDATGAIVGKQPAQLLPDLDEAGLQQARSLLRAFIVGRPPSALIVETDVPGAELYIDGQRVGVTPYTANDIEPGPHKIRLAMEGRAPLTRTVEVPPGETVTEKLVLSAGTPPARQPVVANQTQPEPLELPPAVSWSMVGVGAAISAVGAVVASVGAAIFVAVQPFGTQRAYYERLDTVGSLFLDGPVNRNAGAEPSLPNTQLAFNFFLWGGLISLVGGVLLAASGGGLVFADLLAPSSDSKAAPSSE